MTKASIKKLAANTEVMDKLNTISGLIEINPDDPLIKELIDDVYNFLNTDIPVTNKKYNKEYMLKEIAKVDPEKAERLKSMRFADISFVYHKVMENKNE